VYGYDSRGGNLGLIEALASASPEDVVARLGGQDGVRDRRYDFVAEHGFDLNRCPLPWVCLWTSNCSVRSADFWAVGGFDEDFEGWGLEDTEFGFRIHQKGIPFYFSQQAWVVHVPRERNLPEQLSQLTVNAERFLRKHPEPVIELDWALITRKTPWLWRPECAALREAEGQAPADVADEIATALADCTAGERIAIFGAGARLPDGAAPAYLIDYDKELLDSALCAATAPTAGHHAIGLRTPLDDQCVGTVVITSRLGPLWKQWGTDIIAEAQRVGRTVRVTMYLQHHALDADRASAAGSGGRRRMFLISGTDSTTAVSATMIKPPKVSRVEVPKKLASGAATTTQAGAKA